MTSTSQWGCDCSRPLDAVVQLIQKYNNRKAMRRDCNSFVPMKPSINELVAAIICQFVGSSVQYIHLNHICHGAYDSKIDR